MDGNNLIKSYVECLKMCIICMCWNWKVEMIFELFVTNDNLACRQRLALYT